ncbi:TIGR00366 family protein [Halieaceae bacterium]|nr:TIGR00366 family protein [Halieaceae bacterium]
MRINDSFYIAITITICSLIAVVVFTDNGITDAFFLWGQGLQKLNAYITQIVLVLVVSHALAHTGPVVRVMKQVGKLPRNTAQAYTSVVLVSAMTCFFVSGAMGLIVGAIVARSVAIEGGQKGLSLDFPLLVAAAYSGFVIWHMGVNAIAPLYVATQGNDMQHLTGNIIPLTETVFTTWNLLMAATVVIALVMLCIVMQPSAEKRKDAHQMLMGAKSTDLDQENTKPEKADYSTKVLGTLMLVYLLVNLFVKDNNVDFQVIILWLFSLGLLLSYGTYHYAGLIKNGLFNIAPIIIQYPLYGGIMYLLSDSGLIQAMSAGLVQISSPDTLALVAFYSAGFVNFLIPSGGGQWVIQGPIFLEAARVMDVSQPLMVMAIAYGDQWTNMIQPFWALPILAVVGLGIKDIMAYMFKIFIVTGIIFSVGVYVVSVAGL